MLPTRLLSFISFCCRVNLAGKGFLGGLALMA